MNQKEIEQLPSVNFIYNKCPLCERIGKSLACSQCEKKQEVAYLVHQHGNIHSRKNKMASLMFLSR